MPPDPCRLAHGLPPGGDDHGERRAAAAGAPSSPARTTSSPSRSTPQSCWPGSPRWRGSSATTTRSRARPPSWRPGTPSSSAGWPRVWPSSSAPAGCATSCLRSSPTSSSTTRSLLASHRREIVVVFCDFHGFTQFAETSEPEEVMAVLVDYHRVVGTHVHAHQGTLERFTGDGIMVFFNDPVPCEDPVERAVRMSLDIGDEVQRPGGGLAAPRTRPDAPHGHRPGLRDARTHRFRGPVRLRRHRQRHQPVGTPVHRRR